MCWGSNAWGQLGDNTTVDRHVPTSVVGLASEVKAIATSEQHACALLFTGRVQCWGANDYGQLGDGTTTRRNAPVDVASLASGVAIVAGNTHTCILNAAGGMQCWGNNLNGQLGDGTTTARAQPTSVVGLSSGVANIATSAGAPHTCALLLGGSVQCWGYNGVGQLGDGTTTSRSVPANVVGLSSGASAIAVGGYFTCALLSAGSVQCWGAGDQGQRGDSTYLYSRSVPTTVVGTSYVTSITAGYYNAFAVLSTGGLQAWGDNQFGQLGDGTTTDQLSAVGVVGLLSSVVSVSAGAGHTCAALSTGVVQCWGYNSYGQLGDNTTTDHHMPTTIFPSPVLSPPPSPPPSPPQLPKSVTLSTAIPAAPQYLSLNISATYASDVTFSSSGITMCGGASPGCGATTAVLSTSDSQNSTVATWLFICISSDCYMKIARIRVVSVASGVAVYQDGTGFVALSCRGGGFSSDMTTANINAAWNSALYLTTTAPSDGFGYQICASTARNTAD
jgi:alpha-tubulin suppressor-like RCC1 family protein